MNRKSGFSRALSIGSSAGAAFCVLLLGFVSGCSDVVVNDYGKLPSVTIDSSIHRLVIDEGEAAANPVILSGGAQDKNLSARRPEELYGDKLAWSSSLDGELGFGGRIRVHHLSPGVHTIILTATDHFGNTEADHITIYVNPAGNRLPVPQITAPDHLMNFYYGNTILFSGYATDQIVEIDDEGLEQVTGERGISGDNLLWESNLDGELGAGNEITIGPEQERELSPGVHTITLWAFDNLGIPATTSIAVRILYDEETAPRVRIEYYDSERWWDKEDLRIVEGQSVRLRAVAIDPQDGVLTGDSLAWESSIDGYLGSGVEITTEALSENENSHIVTVTATDSDGNRRSDQIKVRVGPFFVVPL